MSGLSWKPKTYTIEVMVLVEIIMSCKFISYIIELMKEDSLNSTSLLIITSMFLISGITKNSSEMMIMLIDLTSSSIVSISKIENRLKS